MNENMRKIQVFAVILSAIFFLLNHPFFDITKIYIENENREKSRTGKKYLLLWRDNDTIIEKRTKREKPIFSVSCNGFTFGRIGFWGGSFPSWMKKTGSATCCVNL